MKNCWETLGIEPTNDIRVIKKAYAQLLKKEVSDDDILTFQKVKEAFDEAMKRAKSEDLKMSLAQEYFTEELCFQNDIHFQTIQNDARQKLQDTAADNWLALKEALQKLLDDPSGRKNIVNWQSFFWEQELIDFEKFQLIQYQIKDIVLDQYYLFSQEVNEYLLETYHIEDISPEEQIISLKQAIFFPLNLPEKIFDKLKNRYYHLRYLVYECLKNNRMLEVERLLKECKMIYDSDPDLMTLEGIYIIRSNYYQKRDLKRADILMCQALELDSTHHSAYLYHVFLTATDENWKKHKKEIKEALTSYYLLDSALILGFVYSVLEDYEKSAQYFFKVPDYLSTTFRKEIKKVFLKREEELSAAGATNSKYMSKEQKIEALHKIKTEKRRLKKRSTTISLPLISISILLMILLMVIGSVGTSNQNQFKEDEMKISDMGQYAPVYGTLPPESPKKKSERAYEKMKMWMNYTDTTRFLVDSFLYSEEGRSMDMENSIYIAPSYLPILLDKVSQDSLNLKRFYHGKIYSFRSENNDTWTVVEDSSGKLLLIAFDHLKRVNAIYQELDGTLSSQEVEEIKSRDLKLEDDRRE